MYDLELSGFLCILQSKSISSSSVKRKNSLNYHPYYRIGQSRFIRREDHEIAQGEISCRAREKETKLHMAEEKVQELSGQLENGLIQLEDLSCEKSVVPCCSQSIYSISVPFRFVSQSWSELAN